MWSECENMGVKCVQLTANPSYPEELAIWDAVFASLRMGWLISEVVMWVCWFGVQICGYSIIFYTNHCVQEAHFIVGDFMGELEIVNSGVQVVDKFLQTAPTVGPDQEDVINESYK